MFLRIYEHNGEKMKLYATAVFAVSTIDIRGLRKYSDNGTNNIKLDRIFFFGECSICSSFTLKYINNLI